jgi:formylmethanofuran dehydrogenase subunit E
MNLVDQQPTVKLSFPERNAELKVLHCDRCGVDGHENHGVRRYRGVPYCDWCAAKKGLA